MPTPPPPQHGQQPVSGTANPGVVKQDKSSRGSVDTTKTRSGLQRVRMSSGERPMGAAKGKQSDTEALCQTSPTTPPKPFLARFSRSGTCHPLPLHPTFGHYWPFVSVFGICMGYYWSEMAGGKQPKPTFLCTPSGPGTILGKIVLDHFLTHW